MNHATSFRPPRPEDGAQVHQLVSECQPLDQNSVYCNLLQCSHFRDTSVAVDMGDQLVGFISGYLIPDRPDTLFIWQVAVHEQARGLGLASQMLLEILRRPQCAKVSYLETSITADNQASWGLFKRLADRLGTNTQDSILFDRDRHFRGQHDTEYLVKIGPFNNAQVIEAS